MGNNKNYPPLSPELHLTVLAARVNLHAKDLSLMKDLFKENLDWPKILKYSNRFRVQPLLYKHLSQKPFAPAVPPKVLSLLKNEYFRQSMKNLRLYGQIDELVQALKPYHIQLILLKGASLAKFFYGDMALRPMNDIDLLCKEEDKKTYLSVLHNLGYQKKAHFQSPLHEKILVKNMQHIPSLYKPKTPAR